MTRETKLGLAVALAFLALVGGVLGVKLIQGDGPTAGDGSPSVAESKTPETPQQPTTTASAMTAPATESQATTTAVPTGATTAEEPKPLSPIKPDPDAETIKITGGTATPAVATPDSVAPPTTGPTTAPPPVVPAETPPATPTPPPSPTPDAPAEAPKPADPFAPPPPPGPPPGPVPPLDTPKPVPEIHNETPKPAPIIVPSGGGVGDAGPSTPTTPAAPLTAPPPVITPPVTGFNESNSSNIAPATPARPEGPGAAVSDAGPAAQPPAPIGRPTPPVAGTNETAAGSMVPAIAAPASPAPTGASPPNSVTFEKPAGSTGAVTSPAAATTPAFTAPRSPETLAPEVRSAPSVRLEPADPWHGGGGNVAAVGLAPPTAAGGVIVQAPAAGRPPLVKPVAPGGPKAQSYLVEEYRLQAGDNFEKLSQKFYFSPKYAAALQRYNQNEPLAAPGLRANPPMLSVGQVVWMPPARILERDYGEMIPGLQPIPADRGAPGMTTAVRPVTPTGPILYKVRARGESLWEIARHALNDSNQWAQILNLNRNLKPQPEIPIAPGTILRLPPEAKIDATDRP